MQVEPEPDGRARTRRDGRVGRPGLEPTTPEYAVPAPGRRQSRVEPQQRLAEVQPRRHCGDYHGVRVGRVEQLREKEEEQQQQQQRDDLMPSPLHVVKWKQSFADMRRAGSGARRGDDGVDDSPVLSVWDIARTTPKVEELSPRESSKGKFEDEMPASPMSAKGTKGLDKGKGGQDKSQGSAENGQDGGKAAPVADELLILPATTFDGGRALAAARNKKMV